MSKFLFYFLFLKLGILLSAAGVVVGTTPVHSIFFLLACYFFSGFWVLLLGEEFTGLVLMLVYAGALIILFLFTIMVVNLFLEAMPIKNLYRYLFLISIVLFIFSESYWLLCLKSFLPKITFLFNFKHIIATQFLLSMTLYSLFGGMFVLVGIALLCAMVSAYIIVRDYKIELNSKKRILNIGN